MSKTVTVSFPHKLGKDEVRRRTEANIAKARGQLSGYGIRMTQETWDEQGLAFAVGALGQSVQGRLDVGDEVVTLQITLPWMLAMFGGKVREIVQREGRRLIPPPGKA